MNIHTFGDLLVHFPFRHIDKSKITPIGDLNPHGDFVQVKGILTNLQVNGEKRSKRLTATLSDGSGEMSLVWFRSVNWIQKSLLPNKAYNVFGRVSFFNGKPQIAHPETELRTTENVKGKRYMEPVYPSTEKLNAKGLGGRALAKLTFKLFEKLPSEVIAENLPESICRRFKLMPRKIAYRAAHFPKNTTELEQARNRLKFEEFFLSQIRLFRIKFNRNRLIKGWKFDKVGDYFNTYYQDFIPFELTGAQKRVLREIRKDTQNGNQMNRLLQGDVGSGKTMVALLSMLLAIDNGFQTCMMAPTSILAQQHAEGIGKELEKLGLKSALLTGSIKGKKRKEILLAAETGALDILIGTHALIEYTVQFKNL